MYSVSKNNILTRLKKEYSFMLWIVTRTFHFIMNRPKVLYLNLRMMTWSHWNVIFISFILKCLSKTFRIFMLFCHIPDHPVSETNVLHLKDQPLEILKFHTVKCNTPPPSIYPFWPPHCPVLRTPLFKFLVRMHLVEVYITLPREFGEWYHIKISSNSLLWYYKTRISTQTCQLLNNER